MRGSGLGLLLLSSATVVQAQPAPDAGATVSLQQMFNQASEAEVAGKCDVALPIFARLAVDRRVRPGSIPAGAIAVRRGNCLIATGASDEGERAILAGLPILEAGGAGFDAEVAKAHTFLGRLAEARWSHDEAVGHYTAALTRLVGEQRVPALMLLANVRAFDSGPEPLAAVDEALKLLAANAKADQLTHAAFHTVRGRILMNRGENKAALAEMKQALALSGGLSNRVSLSQVAIRGDLAQAAMLNGDKDSARLYLAYTGAGRIEQSPFTHAAVMEPPPCGSETGLTPADVAIVEFGIGDNGDVGSARTIYSRGGYAVATAFARAVSQWHWRPEEIAKVPVFYRALSRVELRCSVAGGGRPEVGAPLAERFGAWAATQLREDAALPTATGARLARLDAIAAARSAAGDPRGAVAALVLRSQSETKADAALAAIDRAQAVAAQADLPADVRNAMQVFRDWYLHRKSLEHREFEPRTIVPEFLALARDPALAQDALAQATLRLLAVPAVPPAAQRDAAIAELTVVADDARLAEHHPLRQLALLQLANIAADAKQFDRAQGWFRRTGLNGQQCALIGPLPALRSSGAGSSDYPEEAWRMGFEGWVRLEYDISADGRAVDSRPIVAYPPIVFADSANAMARGFRFTASFRPEGGEACTANQSTINFRHGQ
ncbi:MAG: energy transducer TonB [Sphingomonadales bacterium]|nr:energy transducer TonB [Sphingomonadales bacterium]